MIDRSNGITTDIDIRIICQIASGIGLLNIFPTNDSARSFLLPLLATVPGCGAVHIYLRGEGNTAAEGAAEQCRVCAYEYTDQYSCGAAELNGTRSYPLETVEQCYGCLMVTVESVSEYEKYEPFVRNLGNAFALVLENRQQKEELQRSNKILEQRVKERTAEIETYFNFSLDLLSIADTDGNFRRLNAEWEKTLGYACSEMEGRNFIDFVHPDDRAATQAEIMKLNAQESVLNFVNRYRCKDGSYRWLEWRSTPAGKIIYSIARDITTRKHTEGIMKAASWYSRNLIEVSLDPLVMISADGKITDVNNATVQITGVDRNELINSDFAKYFTEPERAHQAYRLVFLNGSVTDYPLAIRHVSGKTFDVLYNASLYRDINGIVAGVFAAARNITDQKRAEDSLRRAQKMDSIVMLAGGIAHDFNNLLNAMMGNVSLAKKRIPYGHPAVLNLDRTMAAMERAAMLTKQMLAYSGKGRFQITAIDMTALVREHLSLFEASPSKNVTYTAACSPEPVMINGDPGQIEQVVMNLIINAGEAIVEKQGSVNISVSAVQLSEDELIPYGKANIQILKKGEYALLQVSDNGSGMSEETLAKIFDPFFTTKFVGRGLGLAAVLGIIRGHNGGITVQSTERSGTIFRVIFPLQSQVRDKNELKERNNGAAVRIPTALLIDDEQYIVDMTNDIFSDAQYHLLSATDPEVGVTIYQQQWKTTDIVILDYSMPKMNGKEVLIELRKINPEVKVVMSSGYSKEELAEIMGDVMPSAYIQKPHNPKVLMSVLNSVLGME
jgi:PAS domain S-box-containing protein